MDQIVGSLLFPYISLWMLEFMFGMLPIAGPLLAKIPHTLRGWYVYILLWPFKKLWVIVKKYAFKFALAVWRGLIRATKLLLPAIGRGLVRIGRAAHARIRGTSSTPPASPPPP